MIVWLPPLIYDHKTCCDEVLFARCGQIFFYTALKFSPNRPHATANFALPKIKFAATSHKRPHRNKSII